MQLIIEKLFKFSKKNSTEPVSVLKTSTNRSRAGRQSQARLDKSGALIGKGRAYSITWQDKVVVDAAVAEVCFCEL